MSQSSHTYGPTCHLTRTVVFSGYKDNGDIPLLKAQFFYSSPLPIDDPLSAIPIPGGSDNKSANQPPRPFSAPDNNALEEAWLGLGGKRKKNIKPFKSAASSHKPSSSRSRAPISRQAGANATSPGSGSDNNPLDYKAEDPCIEEACEEISGAKVYCACGEYHSGCEPCPRVFNLTNVTSGDEAPQASGKPFKVNSTLGDKKSPFEASSNDGVQEVQDSPHDQGIEDDHHACAGSSIPTCCQDYEQRRLEHQIPHSSHNRGPDFRSRKPKKLTSKKKGDHDDKRVGQAPGEISHDSEPQETALDGPFERLSREPKVLGKQADMPDSQFPKQPVTGKIDIPQPAQHSTTLSGSLPSQSDDTGTTGLPFLKLPSRSNLSPSAPDDDQVEASAGDPCDEDEIPRRTRERDSTETETVDNYGCKAYKYKDTVDVPVGVSRLHLVKLPALQMKPIYWSPVNDIAAVTRGTWFYKETMLPVEPAVANQLEIGYMELRPWSQTWSDELNSAIEVGAAGEEKIAHRLWPKQEDKKSVARNSVEHTLSTNPYCAARCFQGQAAAEGEIDPDIPDRKSSETKTISKKYPNSQVIYKDTQNAFILKPTLQPSAYYGRKPLAKIKRGTTVGIHVVRGFDWKSWEKLHPSKKTAQALKAGQSAPVAGAADASKKIACLACQVKDQRETITDLVLVIHGIGQKLSERMESFHFTHSINAFRRSVNVELANEPVQRVLRKDFGGTMVLPINWRSNLYFDEGGSFRAGDQEDQNTEFTLKDITPDTIPAIRNMISDVMLDIPFYMSHHKPKMIQAVIAEANRVYRLWCKNNPDFHKDGRVHIIAHSLGSAMALEILSKQPTSVPRIDLSGKKINAKHFDFNTTNLFFAGSPAGFFLLLEKGALLPRRGQSKPGAEHEQNDKSITGEAGTFGCLAVENIYNIMHYNDPIAYRLNATVDPQYAASLKDAQIPSATTGFLESIGNAMRSITPGMAAPSDVGVGQVMKPSAVTRLPSQLEMEVHDFTREEIAEKKFYCLNDNGQVDYFMASGGGPLEIQYLNMLSAHSSYWLSPDFIRMIVIECGRKPGRVNTLPNMRAMKRGRKT